jgi:hypothetical protein
MVRMVGCFDELDALAADADAAAAEVEGAARAAGAGGNGCAVKDRFGEVCALWRGHTCALEMSREVYFEIYLSNKVNIR